MSIRARHRMGDGGSAEHRCSDERGDDVLLLLCLAAITGMSAGLAFGYWLRGGLKYCPTCGSDMRCPACVWPRFPGAGAPRTGVYKVAIGISW
jgi:hypothetical protein